MLDYEWGNPPAIMLNGAVSGDEPTSQPDQNHHITTTFDHYYHPTDTHYLNPTHFTPVYDPYPYPAYPPLLEPDTTGSHSQTGYMLMPKTEPAGYVGNSNGNGNGNGNNRIGLNLNLGVRTYFSSSMEDELVNRVYYRSRPVEAAVVGSPRCQAEGCNADLSHAKHYHRRHKVCEFHSKTSTVITGGLTQRFCQQCSRFHLLCEFDNGKRSCRRRLADHNRRRRKSSQNQDHKSLSTHTTSQSSSS
ncbi:hypothetical protein SSX86_028206 [Deinandra increscens subsp. villosa]|uniref:SBP-type domain-containing protein n=1 Tax=Deinandra increscens subsp. villosa TaxID=3103831 RepID=A0AAP0CE01_9ASTR